ncbi:MAG TPA: acyltransferase family protein, partial [Polyangiaceae bacterium]|nr:acyltransferase family protein [Polyangiaceae bacterium]
MATSRDSAPALTKARYFPALDGLRALSVLAVLAFHAELPSVPGGFLGVEAFFVVSGFLITALLLLEQGETGSISVPKFWLRRARRLLPALFALLVAVLLASLLLAPDALDETRGDIAAALLYVSNWWQVVHHHSYFMAVQRPPLLLHLWSLAVEEQFYLFWPLLIALLGQRAPRWLPPLAFTVALASAARMARLFDPTLDPTRVYIGTDCRLSGLLLGSALAACLRAPLSAREPASRLTKAAQQSLGVVGVLTLLWAFATFTSHDAFIYRGGLVVVDIATCALIVGLVARTHVASLFGARPFAALGRRSYGLYLWHWPIFALTRPDQDVAFGGPRLLLLRLALTFAASELCYRYLEMPVRRGDLAAGLARLRSRPWLLGLGAALTAAATIGVVFLSSARLAAARLDSARPAMSGANLAASSGNAGAQPSREAPRIAEFFPAQRGVALRPEWPKTLTLLSDSVTLAVAKSLPAALPGWKVEVLGRPALMVKQVVPEFLNARSVGSVVVIGLGYNSLFEKDRKNFERWSAVWDRGAERLLADLKACGAKKLVWITLREPSPELVTDAGRDQYREYAWFFPYVNERIHALAARHPELAVADW